MIDFCYNNHIETNKEKIQNLEEIMSLLILVLSLLLIIEILEIIVVQNKQHAALKVSKNDFIMSVNGKDVMTNFAAK